MALSVDTMNPKLEGDFHDIPVADNVLIYEGALIMLDGSGYATPMTGAAVKFAGVAYRQADNTITGHAAGGINCKIDASIHRRQMAITGATRATCGQPVYATADGTLTMTAAAAACCVGTLVDYVSSGVGVVLLTPYAPRVLQVAEAGGANPSAAEFKALLDALIAAGILNKHT
jgi:hypothetical protein